MTWEDQKTIIISALSGYNRVIDNREINEVTSKEHDKSYVLTPNGTMEISSDSYYDKDGVTLDVIYYCKDADSVDANYDDFKTLQDTIYNLSGFESFDGKRTFGRLDNYTNLYKGTIKFYME